MKINEENLLITDEKKPNKNNLTNGSPLIYPFKWGYYFCLPMEETG
jgi:hypothetical protein